MGFLKNFKQSTDTFNSFFNALKNIGALITCATSIVTAVLSIKPINEWTNNLLKPLDTEINFRLVFKISFCIFLILISLFIIQFICKAIKVSIQAKRINTAITKTIHKDFIHSIRSQTAELDGLAEKLKMFSSKSEIENIYNKELEKLKQNLQPYVDKLAEYISAYRNVQVSVCIKSFLNGSRYKEDYLDEEIITLARSNNTISQRKVNTSPVIVKDNTDFIDLCLGQKMFFGEYDLYRLYTEGNYKNSSPDWWKYYNSTLVVPIRYFNKEGINNRINIQIDIIGFLCIDCKNDIIEWKNSDSFELQLLAIIVDALYTYIRLFYNCFDNVGYFKNNKE